MLFLVLLCISMSFPLIPSFFFLFSSFFGFLWSLILFLWLQCCYLRSCLPSKLKTFPNIYVYVSKVSVSVSLLDLVCPSVIFGSLWELKIPSILSLVKDPVFVSFRLFPSLSVLDRLCQFPSLSVSVHSWPSCSLPSRESTFPILFVATDAKSQKLLLVHICSLLSCLSLTRLSSYQCWQSPLFFQSPEGLLLRQKCKFPEPLLLSTNLLFLFF